jgi:hypothetical protein
VSVRDAYEVMGPIYERDARYAEQRLRLAEKIILRLRQRLIAIDPSLPNDPYDGTAWMAVEQVDA